MNVQHILGQKDVTIVSIAPTATLKEAADLLRQHRIGAVVVLENERLAGILSERDIVRNVSVSGAAALDQRVADTMTRKVTTCSPSETVMDVMMKMTEGRFRHLPVCEGDRLVGVVSIGDIVKRRIEEAEREAQDLKDYIAMA